MTTALLTTPTLPLLEREHANRLHDAVIGSLPRILAGDVALAYFLYPAGRVVAVELPAHLTSHDEQSALVVHLREVMPAGATAAGIAFPTTISAVRSGDELRAIATITVTGDRADGTVLFASVAPTARIVATSRYDDSEPWIADALRGVS